MPVTVVHLNGGENAAITDAQVLFGNKLEVGERVTEPVNHHGLVLKHRDPVDGIAPIDKCRREHVADQEQKQPKVNQVSLNGDSPPQGRGRRGLRLSTDFSGDDWHGHQGQRKHNPSHVPPQHEAAERFQGVASPPPGCKGHPEEADARHPCEQSDASLWSVIPRPVKDE